MTEWEFSKVKYVCRYCTEERVGSATARVCNHCLNDDPAKLCRLKDCPLFDKEEEFDPNEDITRKEKNMHSNANEGHDEVYGLTEENKALKAEVEALKRTLEDLQNKKSMWYKDGLIDGLKFAIRCNGVSGNEVNG